MLVLGGGEEECNCRALRTHFLLTPPSQYPPPPDPSTASCNGCARVAGLQAVSELAPQHFLCSFTWVQYCFSSLWLSFCFWQVSDTTDTMVPL